MKLFLLKFSILLVGVAGMFSCTVSDKAVSTNTNLPDSRILGYWIYNDQGIKVHKKPDGKTYVDFYKYDSKKETHSISKEDTPLYFYSINDGNESYYFCSKKYENGYTTFLFKIIQNNTATAKILDFEQLAKRFYNAKTAMYEFGNGQSFQNFLEGKKADSRLYSASYTLYRVKDGTTLLNEIKKKSELSAKSNPSEVQQQKSSLQKCTTFTMSELLPMTGVNLGTFQKNVTGRCFKFYEKDKEEVIYELNTPSKFVPDKVAYDPSEYGVFIRYYTDDAVKYSNFMKEIKSSGFKFSETEKLDYGVEHIYESDQYEIYITLATVGKDKDHYKYSFVIHRNGG